MCMCLTNVHLNCTVCTNNHTYLIRIADRNIEQSHEKQTHTHSHSHHNKQNEKYSQYIRENAERNRKGMSIDRWKLVSSSKYNFEPHKTTQNQFIQ